MPTEQTYYRTCRDDYALLARHLPVAQCAAVLLGEAEQCRAAAQTFTGEHRQLALTRALAAEAALEVRKAAEARRRR